MDAAESEKTITLPWIRRITADIRIGMYKCCTIRTKGSHSSYGFFFSNTFGPTY